MANIIEHPSLGQIEFPDEMADADIISAIKRLESQGASVPAPTAAAPTPVPQAAPVASVVPDWVTANRPSSGVFTRRSPEIPVEQRPPTQVGPEYQAFQQERQLADIRSETQPVIKYAPVVAAGMATGGMSTLAQSAIAGTAMAAGSLAVGETPREAAAQGIIAATPLMKFGTITPFMPKMEAAKVIGQRVAAQIPVAAAFEQTSEIAGGTFEPPKDPGEALSRLLTPTTITAGAITGVAGGVERAARSSRVAQDIRAVRGDEAGMLASELDPRFVPLEARRVVVADPRARAALRDLYSDFDPLLFETVSQAPNATQIAEQLAPFVGMRQRLATAAQEAEAAAARAQQAYQDAVRSGSGNVARAKEAAQAAAKDAAYQKAAFEYQMKQFSGEASTPSLAALSPEQNTESLQRVLESTFAEQKSALGRMWSEVGIGLNDPIMTKQGLLRRIEMLSRDSKNALSGADAKAAAIAQIESLFPAPSAAPAPTILGPTGKPLSGPAAKQSPIQISRERYLDLRDEIADGLEKNGMVRDRAEKLSGEIYSAVRTAADDYINVAMPDKAAQWQRFNKTAANWFEARDNPFIRDFVNPRTGTLREGKARELVSQMIRGEAGNTVKALDQIATSIQANGDEASIAAANLFKENVSSYIAKGILENAVLNRVSGVASDAALFDSAKLYQTVNKLASGGRFDVSRLKLGTPEDLNRLAKMANNRMVSRAELTDFFNDVQSIGGDAAAARLEYRRELKAQLLARPSVRESADEVRRRAALARKAKLDAASAQAELVKAQKDPLVQVFGQGDFGFSGDLTSGKLGGALASLLTVPNDSLRSLVGAMRQSKPQLLDQLAARKVADIMGNYSNVIPGSIPQADVRGIRNFMFSPDFSKEREGLHILLGPQGYRNFQNLVDRMAPRSRAEALVAREMGVTAASPDSAAKGLFAAGGLASGNLQSGVVGGQGVFNIKRAIDNGRYSTLYYLYINPRSARQFASVSYNLDKFINQSGVHRVALQIAERQDNERAAQEQPAEPQP